MVNYIRQLYKKKIRIFWSHHAQRVLRSECCFMQQFAFNQSGCVYETETQNERERAESGERERMRRTSKNAADKLLLLLDKLK